MEEESGRPHGRNESLTGLCIFPNTDVTVPQYTAVLSEAPYSVNEDCPQISHALWSLSMKPACTELDEAMGYVL